MPEDYPEAYDVKTQEGQDYRPESGYEAGEPLEGHFEIPEFVEVLRSQLNEVREAISDQNNKRWKATMDGGMYREMDIVEELAQSQSMDHLYDEERRLQQAIRDAIWLIPPSLEPPHNASVSREKAREILSHGEVRGQALTDAQRGFFGVIASGKTPRIASKRGK